MELQLLRANRYLLAMVRRGKRRHVTPDGKARASGMAFTEQAKAWLTRNLGDGWRFSSNHGSLLDLEASLHDGDIYSSDDLSELARDCAAFLQVQEPAARAAEGCDDFMKDSAVLRRWADAHAAPLRRRGLSLLAEQGDWGAGDHERLRALCNDVCVVTRAAVSNLLRALAVQPVSAATTEVLQVAVERHLYASSANEHGRAVPGGAEGSALPGLQHASSPPSKRPSCPRILAPTAGDDGDSLPVIAGLAPLACGACLCSL